jgi:predicted transcriptional regulator
MAKDEIKKQLHLFIDMIEDESQLQMLNDAAEVYVTKQPDIIDLLTPEQLQRLEESIKQADEGKLTSHDEVKKTSSQWLTK